MKKILILTLATLLSLGVVSTARAGTVAVDVWSGGEVGDTDESYDLSQVTIGVDVPADQFKFAASTSGGSFKTGSYDFDTESIILKGGYALIDNDQIRLDITGGFYHRGIDWNYRYYTGYDLIETQSLYSIFLGFDSKINFDKKAWVNFSYCYGINPQSDAEGYLYSYTPIDLDSISILNLKFNYLLTKEIGASLGYHCEKIENNNAELNFSGLTIGAFYKF